MKTLDTEQVKNLILLEIFAPDPYSENEPLLPENERNEAHDKYKQGLPWKEVFGGVKDEKTRVKLIELLEHIDARG